MEIDRFLARLSRLSGTGTTRFKVGLSPEEFGVYLRAAFENELGPRSPEPWEPDPETAAHIRKVSKWITGDHRTGLMLYGRIGSGKTTMGNALCKTVQALCYSPLRSESRVIRRTTALELARLARTEDERFESIRSADLLFIDDVGIEPVSVKNYGNEMTPVTDVLYHRYENRLFTIISTNLDKEMITEMYGERIGDRFNEMFDRISYRQESYRK